MTERPLLSVIVVFFNMRREAARTLYSLTRSYQLQAHDLDYEVIAVDNGSTEPLDPADVTRWGPEFRYYQLDTQSVSPAGAVNFASTKARGRYIAVCVDGARILSPGVLHFTRLAARLHDAPIIATLAWHLGPKSQPQAVEDGYNQVAEDALLAGIDWQNDGYQLFQVSSPAHSSANGWFLPFGESNCLTVPRGMFDELGGFDERFCAPGGGLVNLDYLKRALDLPRAQLVVLLGEGTFHQCHGGIATNVSMENQPWNMFAAEYERIRGKRFRVAPQDPLFLGTFPPTSLPFLRRSVDKATEVKNGAGKLRQRAG